GQRACELLRATFVASEDVLRRSRETVHGTARWHARCDRVRLLDVLDGGQEPLLEDADHLDQPLTEKNLTRSPARNSDGGSESGRNSLTEVRPMRCQPPGLGRG